MIALVSLRFAGAVPSLALTRSPIHSKSFVASTMDGDGQHATEVLTKLFPAVEEAVAGVPPSCGAASTGR